MKSLLYWEYLLCIQNYLTEPFVTLTNHISYLHPNIEYVAILYFYHNILCICY